MRVRQSWCMVLYVLQNWLRRICAKEFGRASRDQVTEIPRTLGLGGRGNWRELPASFHSQWTMVNIRRTERDAPSLFGLTFVRFFFFWGEILQDLKIVCMPFPKCWNSSWRPLNAVFSNTEFLLWPTVMSNSLLLDKAPVTRNSLTASFGTPVN